MELRITDFQRDSITPTTSRVMSASVTPLIPLNQWELTITSETAAFVMASFYGGCTIDLPWAELRGGKAPDFLGGSRIPQSV